MSPVQSLYKTGLVLTLLSAACVSISCLFSLKLLHSFHLSLFVFLRFAVPLLFLLPYLLIRQFNFQTENIKSHLVRALQMVISQYCLFYYFMHGGSLVDGTLLFCTSPIFIPIISRIAFGSRIQLKTLACIIISFIGVTFILRPDKGLIDFITCVGLLSGFFSATSQIGFHQLAHKDHPMTLVLYMHVLASIVAVIPLLFFWKNAWVNTDMHHLANEGTMFMLLMFALTVTINQIARGLSYQYVRDLASLGPFTYASIIFSALLDWVFHSKTPGILTGVGALFIIGGGLLMFYRKKPSIATNLKILTSTEEKM